MDPHIGRTRFIWVVFIQHLLSTSRYVVHNERRVNNGYQFETPIFRSQLGRQERYNFSSMQDQSNIAVSMAPVGFHFIIVHRLDGVGNVLILWYKFRPIWAKYNPIHHEAHWKFFSGRRRNIPLMFELMLNVIWPSRFWSRWISGPGKHLVAFPLEFIELHSDG